MRGSTRRHDALLINLKAALPVLRALQDRCATRVDANAVYRFYHQSFKAFDAQRTTVEIVQALRVLAPETSELHPWFMEIVSAGTVHSFDIDVHNAEWPRLVGPILSAHQHARWFLDEVIRCAELESAPSTLPERWAAVLYLYGLRHDA